MLEYTGLGPALGGLAFGLTLVVVVLVAVDAPARMRRLVEPGAVVVDRTVAADRATAEPPDR